MFLASFHITVLINYVRLNFGILVQAFYHEKSVNLPLIAKEGF